MLLDSGRYEVRSSTATAAKAMSVLQYSYRMHKTQLSRRCQYCSTVIVYTKHNCQGDVSTAVQLSYAQHVCTTTSTKLQTAAH